MNLYSQQLNKDKITRLRPPKKQTTLSVVEFISIFLGEYIKMKTTLTSKMTSNINTKPKKFESCFAVGLDLSEFSSTDQKSSQISAAAELLQVKNRERIQKELEDQEEEIMQQSAAKRVKKAERMLYDASKQMNIIKSCGGGAGFSSNVLIDMHSSDLSGGKKETGKNKKVAKKSTNYKIKGFSLKRMRKR